MPNIRPLLTAATAMAVLTAHADAQDAQEEARAPLHPGSAVIRQQGGDSEALIRLLCDVAGRPEAGFTTEANRITRSDTGGRYNRASLRLRLWQDTGDVLITTDWGVAWLPRPASAGGILSMALEVRPGRFVRNGIPVLVTYDMWKAGDVPDERTVVEFEADCTTRDPAAPSWRRLPESEPPAPAMR